MSLIDKTYLCYINIEFLEQWVKEKKTLVSNFISEKEKWRKEINFQSNFFADSELLLVNDGLILLKVIDDIHANFLAKIYQLEYQKICQKIFQEKKNIILITEKQWEEINSTSLHRLENEKVIVLFKDEESVKKSLSD
jgi:hypothetical protein